jgi:predicted kinase
VISTKGRVILITGVMASGKSTVAQALAERLPRSVHLRGDIFRRMIVHGQAEMRAELSEEAAQQLQLRYDIAVEVARRYAKAGFTVVYQDIILGHKLAEVSAAFGDVDVTVVVLAPDLTAIAKRESDRGKRGYGSRAEMAKFDRVLREETPKIGLWLDTTHLTVGETVDAILEHVNVANA